MQTHYYYKKLEKTQQKVYDALLEGFLELTAVITVPRMEYSELQMISFLLRLDYPEVFWIKGFSCRQYAHASHMEVIPEYLFERKKINVQQQAMSARIKKLIQPVLQQKELEKLQYIHDFVCQQIRYDKLKKSYSHEIIGPLGHGVGVCEGMAKTVKILCDALQLWCIVVIGEANPVKGIRYRHAWNMVCVNGVYYHLDVTFDNHLSRDEIIRYDYYMLADVQLFRDHEPTVWSVPNCIDSDHFYYREQKLSFTKLEEVQKRTVQALKKGKSFLFHWRGGGLSQAFVVQLLQMFQKEAEARGKHSCVSWNMSQAVFAVTFLDGATGQIVQQETGTVDDGVEMEKNRQDTAYGLPSMLVDVDKCFRNRYNAYTPKGMEA